MVLYFQLVLKRQLHLILWHLQFRWVLVVLYFQLVLKHQWHLNLWHLQFRWRLRVLWLL